MGFNDFINKILINTTLSEEETDLFYDQVLLSQEIEVIYSYDDKDNKVTLAYLKLILNKIKNEKSDSRKLYYFEQLKKSLTSCKTSKYNDINLNRWQEYENIITDSLWVMNYRDKTGAHKGDYWGNFIPQIPNQMFLRYTKKDDWVLDPFLGSGTSAIEGKRLGRNVIGIELQDSVLHMAKANIDNQPGDNDTVLLQGDSRTIDLSGTLQEKNIKSLQFILMHPPYWDIIKFSGSKEDLSNAASIEDFLNMLGDIIDNTTKFLDKGRFVAIVIGDKYQNSELIPLGFYCMQEFLNRGFLLKSTIVKNFNETKGKMNQAKLWRYRALSGGFYIFKHEYIFVFQKR